VDVLGGASSPWVTQPLLAANYSLTELARATYTEQIQNDA